MGLTKFPPPWRLGAERFGSAPERLRHRWGVFVVFGALVMLLGLAALILVFSATIASVFMIAVFMIIAGGAEVVTGFSARNWGRSFLWIIAGLVYLVIGAFALAQPLVAALFFTFVLGLAMVAMGLVRIFLAAHLGPGGHWPVIAAAAVTALLGLFILVGWPGNSFVILGTLLGLDLLFWGGGGILFGLRLRRLA
jgi:uncharacterized membrane protein HdeD (DUF308 family)